MKTDELIKEIILYLPKDKLIDIYTDPGYTGTNFNSPEFQRMKKIEKTNLKNNEV